MKQKEQEELKALLDAPGDEEDSSNDQKNKNDAPSEGDENNNGDDKSKSGSESDEDNADNKDKDKSKSETKNKKREGRWHGKSREEIIKELEALEENDRYDFMRMLRTIRDAFLSS